MASIKETLDQLVGNAAILDTEIKKLQAIVNGGAGQTVALNDGSRINTFKKHMAELQKGPRGLPGQQGQRGIQGERGQPGAGGITSQQVDQKISDLAVDSIKCKTLKLTADIAFTGSIGYQLIIPFSYLNLDPNQAYIARGVFLFEGTSRSSVAAKIFSGSFIMKF